MPRTALVTGASRGIGLATARLLAEKGYRVISLARGKPESQVGEAFFQADLADPQSLDAVFGKINEAFEVDVLVNNAAVSILAPLEEATLEQFSRQVELNMRALMQCTQAVMGGMRRRGFGRVVNISSRSALGKPRLSVYGATKAGVIGFTRGWALEVARDGITVNCIAPGPIETEMYAANFPPGSAGRQGILNEVAMRRAGKPEEIAAAVAYFASEDAGFTTGQVLYVCGGATVGFAGM